ncbi:1819_t:CDS:1, partial [Ambispora gerdemannii]
MTNFTSPNYAYLTDHEIQILQQCPYRLTLTIDELTKSAVRKYHDFDKSPRPQNSWIIFRRDYEAYLRLCDRYAKSTIIETAKECSSRWKKLSSEVKDFFKILERIACENHKRVYPDYKYKPKNPKNSSGKKFIFREQKKYPTSSANPNSSTSLSSTVTDNNQDYTNNFTIAIYNNQDYTNNFTTAIYNHQDYSDGLTTIPKDYSDGLTTIHQDYSDGLTTIHQDYSDGLTTIHQDYSDWLTTIHQDYTDANDLTQNSINNA